MKASTVDLNFVNIHFSIEQQTELSQNIFNLLHLHAV